VLSARFLAAAAGASLLFTYAALGVGESISGHLAFAGRPGLFAAAAALVFLFHSGSLLATIAVLRAVRSGRSPLLLLLALLVSACLAAACGAALFLLEPVRAGSLDPGSLRRTLAFAADGYLQMSGARERTDDVAVPVVLSLATLAPAAGCVLVLLAQLLGSLVHAVLFRSSALPPPGAKLFTRLGWTLALIAVVLGTAGRLAGL
jgi:hypothetical protein